ncbi:MAG: type II secretion system protein [Francisella endosymbiont of Hyalomma scupense]
MQKSFSLTELLIVITIISVLSIMVIPAVFKLCHQNTDTFRWL